MLMDILNIGEDQLVDVFVDNLTDGLKNKKNRSILKKKSDKGKVKKSGSIEEPLWDEPE